MNTKYKLHLLCVALLCLPGLAYAQSTAFSYTGRLNNNGVPVNGAHDVRFTVYDAVAAGNAVAGPINVSPVEVTNGLFSARIDFGAGAFTGPPRWLNIEVRPVGAVNYTQLSPRQELTSSPYAIQARTAASVANGTVTANQLNTGGLAPAPGQFLSYNGGSLLWSDPGIAVGNIWSRSGADAYYTAGNVGIGTSTPLAAARLHVKGSTVLESGGSGGGFISFGTPSAESGITINGNGTKRADLRFDGVTLKLLAHDASGPPSAADGITINATSGNVGIGGSFTPVAKLEVVGQDALRLVGFNPFLTLLDSSAGYARARIQSVGGDMNLFTESYLSGANTLAFLKLANNGNVGLGSANPAGKLEVAAQDALRLIGYQPFLTILDSSAGYARSRIQSADGEMILAPENYLNGTDANAYAKLFNSGNFSVKTLTIRGGADLAEPFELSARDIAKGSVLIIDEEHPGKLKLSTHAYDTRVAGIVSGANGVNPGISLHQDGVLGSGQDVALSGRVYVLADATKGAIKPGDLLTTSDTPGHAMKVANPTQSQGAILGKAMSGLKDGKGTVLVLVTLQ